MEAELLVIGDEILTGQTIDTNTGHIARELNRIGISLSRVHLTGDRPELIRQMLEEATGRSKLVLTTGGLGPTSDDITRQALADFFDSELEVNEDALSAIKQHYKARNRELNEYAEIQARLPKVARPIPNPVGTAPAIWIEEKGVIVISMPGVPHETAFIVQNHIAPLLKERFGGEAIVHHNFLFTGIYETEIATLLRDFESELPENARIAYLPDLGYVHVRLTCRGEKEAASSVLEELKKKLHQAAGAHIAGEDSDTVSSVLGRVLLERQASISTAESCTGGKVAMLLTSIPGSSSYYMGSLVAYDNEVKMRELNVQEETLDEHGAVSEATVKEMVAGCLKKFNTQYAIATSGIAGPGGGKPGKPVGTIWVAVGSEKSIFAKKFKFNRNREQNINLTANLSLDLARRCILEGKI